MNILTPNWPAPKQVRAFTTLRSSWGSKALTNLASEQNRHVLIEAFNLPNDPIWLTQTHSASAIEANKMNQGKIADASFTRSTGIVCMILTADCLPILLSSKDGSVVAAIHAGWKGLAAGIIETTVAQLAISPDDLLAWFGPAIGPDHYVVGEDVYQAFTQVLSSTQLAFKSLGNKKWLANLYQLAQIKLAHLKIQNIYGGNWCTYSQPDRFYSYRRDGKDTGRMASMIWIDAN